MSRFEELRYRQIHLDFHTSEAIPDIGRDFDAPSFVSTLKDAHVDSITLFARCHHGWCYYPSQVGDIHPQLARPDLLGEMIAACNAADIQTPVYITVQWDENLARTRPEWRVMRAENSGTEQWARENSAQNQLSPIWHTLCLSHRDYWGYLVEMGREIIANYDVPGLFYDIVGAHDCVCPTCIRQMQEAGLDPTKAEDRQKNDIANVTAFRTFVSNALWSESPSTRIFYNAGHIYKKGASYYDAYSHLELESLPTGFWGYDHFPTSARYSQNLGMDFLGQTGKFHTAWGEFGGYKSANALIYEVGQMAALGAKCMIGDQLHPLGHVNKDTYASIKPAYKRLEALEPYLERAKPVVEIALVALEHFADVDGNRNQQSDAGAVKMLLEMQAAFTVIDPDMPFDGYKLLILPDSLPVNKMLSDKISKFVASGGKVLFTGTSGLEAETSALALDAGIRFGPEPSEFDPCYISPIGDAIAGIPRAPSVVYRPATKVELAGAKALAMVEAPYFNRTYAAFCSHQHSPENTDADPIGPAVTLNDGFGYIAFEIFAAYYDVGQPIYKYIVKSLIDALIGEPVLTTTLPSAGRAYVNHQSQHNRCVVHLLYGGPQMRGRRAPDTAAPRPMEMIEDIPVLADVDVSFKVDQPVTRVFDALTQEAMTHDIKGGRLSFRVERLNIHRAIVVEYDAPATETGER